MTPSDIVNDWFRERLACGALARDTEAYNQVAAALPDLIGRLAPPAPQPAPAKGGKAAKVSPPAPEVPPADPAADPGA